MPVFLIVVILLAGVGLVCFVRYLSVKREFTLPDDLGKDAPDLPEPDFNGFIQRFSRMIQLPTISWTDRSKRDLSLFRAFQESLVEMYPEVHKTMTREVHGDFGLIYHWKGKNDQKKPVLFLAHYDVVPAEEKGDESWDEPPFSGRVKEGILWGRGTLDIKCQLAFLKGRPAALVGMAEK